MEQQIVGYCKSCGDPIHAGEPCYLVMYTQPAVLYCDDCVLHTVGEEDM